MTSTSFRFVTLAAAVRAGSAAPRLLAVFALALALKGGLVWWHWAEDVKQRVADNAAVEQRARMAAFAMPRDHDVALLRARMIAASDSFVLAPTATQAAAVAAAAISEAASAGEVRLGTVDPRVDSVTHDGVRTVALDGEVKGELSGVLAFVHELEAGTPLFEIAHLSITPATWSPTGGVVTAHFAVKALTRRTYSFER